MVGVYTKEERLFLWNVYNRHNRSPALALREFGERFPNRPLPNRKIFCRIENNLQSFGSLEQRNRHKKATVMTEENEMNILLYFTEFPENSLRDASRTLQISYSSIQKVLKKFKWKAYKYMPTQFLTYDDCNKRMEFCGGALERHFNGNFFQRVLWTDEASFTTAGIYNRKNSHYWSSINPKKNRCIKKSGRSMINVWCGILNTQIIGPIFFNQSMNGNRFLEILRREIIPLLENHQDRNNLIFQMDGAPYHTRADVKMYLEENFEEVLDLGSHLSFPPRSPDLTPLDFFLWGYLKNKVYENRADNIEELKDRIRNEIVYLNNSDILVKIIPHLEVRYTTCIAERGGFIEHLIK